jgi:ribosomal-protein-alanine N-acetyltransferase
MIDLTIFDQFPVLSTSRLTLREIVPGDARAILTMRSNKQVNRFIARDSMNELSGAEELARKSRQAFYDKKGIAWAGRLREQAEIIGTCGFNRIDFQNHRAEIGGELDTRYWGKGIALEAVRTIVHFGFHALKLHAIEAMVDPGNRGAIFLMEELGFNKEAHFRDRIFFNGHYRDLAVYCKINT